MSEAASLPIVREAPDAALVLVKHYEGFQPKLYGDPAGNPTIGYGHMIPGYQAHIFAGVTWDENQATMQAQKDLASAATELCAQLPASVIGELTDGQYAALCDFMFNEGSGHFFGSTLKDTLIACSFDAVPAQLMRWVYSEGVVLKGLWRRRRAESLLWQGTDAAAAIAQADTYE